MRYNVRLLGGALVLGAMLASPAAMSVERPKEATALCKDGTFYTGADQLKACTKNGGVQEWWGKVLPPKDVPNRTPASGKDGREPYDKALHPQDVTPPAGEKR